jgi:hypothetical protein
VKVGKRINLRPSPTTRQCRLRTGSGRGSAVSECTRSGCCRRLAFFRRIESGENARFRVDFMQKSSNFCMKSDVFTSMQPSGCNRADTKRALRLCCASRSLRRKDVLHQKLSYCRAAPRSKKVSCETKQEQIGPPKRRPPRKIFIHFDEIAAGVRFAPSALSPQSGEGVAAAALRTAPYPSRTGKISDESCTWLPSP